jgi:hypothetical protein
VLDDVHTIHPTGYDSIPGLPVNSKTDRITRGKSAALSEVSRRESLDEQLDANAETPSITRLEGSRWRGGRLWSYKPDSTMSR